MGYRMANLLGGSSGSELIPAAVVAAKRAVELDDTLAEAHAALGAGEAASWNWEQAKREFRRALELNPGVSYTHHLYAFWYLVPTGRMDEAVTEMERALELDPLSLLHSTVLGSFLYYRRQYDQAIEQLQETLTLAPNFSSAYLQLAPVYVKKGMYEEAIAAARKESE